MTFQTSVGFDGPMYEDGWAKLAAMIGQRFSVGGPTDWQVVRVTGTRQVSAAAGAGFAAGIRSSTVGATLLTVPQPTFGRWYLLVCRRNWNPNTANGETPAGFVLIPGPTTGNTSAATVPTSAPTSYPAGYNDAPGTLVDQPLAWVWTRNSDTSMAIFDLRTLPLDGLIKAIRSDVNFANRASVPFATAAGTGSETFSSENAMFDLALPSGRFTVPPIVTMITRSNEYGTKFSAVAVSASSVAVLGTAGQAGLNIPYQWIAVQMTPTTAAG